MASGRGTFGEGTQGPQGDVRDKISARISDSCPASFRLNDFEYRFLSCGFLEDNGKYLSLHLLICKMGIVIFTL